MESDDISRAPDPLTLLARQDLDPLSLADLETRIEALETEVRRVRQQADRVTAHRAAADSFFKR